MHNCMHFIFSQVMFTRIIYDNIFAYLEYNEVLWNRTKYLRNRSPILFPLISNCGEVMRLFRQFQTVLDTQLTQG